VKLCSWCDKSFKPSVSYQIYCSLECRNDATKEKIIERHRILKRQKRKNKIRYCAGGCNIKLSIYNDTKYCDNCTSNSKEIDKKIKEIRMLMHDYEDQTKRKQ
jgi:hypothetical protein